MDLLEHNLFKKTNQISPIYVPTLFPLYINDLPDNVICNIVIVADYTFLYPACDQASDRWQQLELAFAPGSDLRDTVAWDRKWLVDFH